MAKDQPLINKEQAAWKALEDKRYDDLGNMFAGDYQEVADGELVDKAAALAGIKQATFSNIMLSDTKVTWIDKNTAIVTSIVSATISAPNGMSAPNKMRTTSIWTKRGKDWLVVYHTGSMIK